MRTFNLILLFLVVALVTAFSQPTLTPTSTGSAAPGLPYTVDIVISGVPTTGPGIAYVGFTASIPAGWTITATSTPVAGKQISCATTAVAPLVANPGRCVLWGVQTALANGTIATITYTPPAGAGTGISVINLSGLSTTDTTGAIGGAGAGNNLNVNVIAYDLNHDSVVSNADVLEEVAQVVASHACTNGDLNGDSQCRLNDLFIMYSGWVAYGSNPTP